MAVVKNRPAFTPRKALIVKQNTVEMQKYLDLGWRIEMACPHKEGSLVVLIKA